MRRWARRWLRRVLLALGVAALVYVGFALWLAWRLLPVEDPARYARVLAGDWPARLVAHFPPRIPRDARDVRFHYQRGFLQGGAHLELRYRTTPPEVHRLARVHRAAASLVAAAPNAGAGLAIDFDRVPVTRFFTVARDELPAGGLALLPGGYEILVLRSRPPAGIAIDRNHGEAAGLAVRAETGDVIFWAAAW